MSQGARLTAVIVVVTVAAIGLYFAVMAPPAQQQDQSADPSVAVAELAPAGAGTTLEGTGTAPAAEAFAPPSTAMPTAPATTTVAGTAATASTAASSGTAPSGPASTVTNSPDPLTLVGAPVAPAAPASARTYVIKSGDTLEGIARAELGDGQRWRSIIELNPGLDPKSLKIGRSITLPEGSAPTRTASTTAESASGKKATASSGSTYTVQKGDTLFGIARKVYGSAGDAEIRRIVAANSGTLKSKDTPLKPGMKLAIPSKP